MSTVRGAILTSIAIVSGGFLIGQLLQPDTRTESIRFELEKIRWLEGEQNQDEDHTNKAHHQSNSFSQSELSRLPLSELKRNLKNLEALKRNVEAERSIIMNKLVEVERRIELKRRETTSSNSSTENTVRS